MFTEPVGLAQCWHFTKAEFSLLQNSLTVTFERVSLVWCFADR